MSGASSIAQVKKGQAAIGKAAAVPIVVGAFLTSWAHGHACPCRYA